MAEYSKLVRSQQKLRAYLLAASHAWGPKSISRIIRGFRKAQTSFVLFTSISIFLNILLGVFVFSTYKVDERRQYIAPITKYTFLSPRIYAENQNELIVNFVELRTKLQAETKKMQGIAVYFEYLPSGVSIGINEKQSYVLASLLKTPMMMAVYKQIESGRWREDDVLTITQEDLDPYFGELYKQGAGAKITLREAIRQSLVYSDNTAKSVLFSHLPDKALDDVFDYLDIPKERAGLLPVVTAKNYSSILRSLYLSSYLTKESSNEILEFLTQSPFDDKLTQPIPKNIKVAHKIGVYGSDVLKNAVFTDCGIVYYPKRPYILCLMQAAPEKDVQRDMSKISKIVYEYISQLQPL